MKSPKDAARDLGTAQTAMERDFLAAITLGREGVLAALNETPLTVDFGASAACGFISMLAEEFMTDGTPRQAATQIAIESTLQAAQIVLAAVRCGKTGGKQ